MGVTHLSIALCNYCTSKQKKKCAYLELHGRNEISQLVPEAKLLPSKTKCINARDDFTITSQPGLKERPCFRLNGVDYYPAITAEEIPALLNMRYDYLILDIGTLQEATFSEFLRCDRKLILGSLAPWKLWKYEAFFLTYADILNLGEGFDYLIQTGCNPKNSSFSRTHHIKMQFVPFIKNPFRIEKELFPFLGALSAERY